MKTFDSVKLMRELRSQMSQEMEHMDPKERIQYIRDKAASIRLGRLLEDDDGDACQADDPADDASPRS